MAKSVEDRLREWVAQNPAVCKVTEAEASFIGRMREAARLGVGYGWMKQIIDWEWAATCPHHVAVPEAEG